MRAATSLAAAALAIAIGPALSADLPRPYAEPPQQLPVWSGFYIGGNGGYGWGKIETSSNSMTTNGPLVGLPPNTFPTTTFPGDDRAYDVKGAFGGAQAGFNWQSGALVLGVETDIQGGDLDGTDAFLGSAAGPAYTGNTELEWFGTTRARLGYAIDGWLPYVTGGVAYGGFSSNLTIQPGTFSAPIGSPFYASRSDRATGYAVGAGIEAVLTGNWTAKIEYLHIDLGSTSATYDFGSAGSAHADADFAFDLVRAGINYRF